MAHPTHVWPTMKCTDAKAEIDFLVAAFGFEATFVVPAEPGNDVPHAVLRWPSGGGVMLGSAGAAGDDDPFSSLPTGGTSVYVVTDDPDALFERATGAGAEVVRPLVDTDYGSREFTVRDPEGNLWSFGTYAGS
jgi:uncharacterized glyoxalase superfamily protein PhnB